MSGVPEFFSKKISGIKFPINMRQTNFLMLNRITDGGVTDVEMTDGFLDEVCSPVNAVAAVIVNFGWFAYITKGHVRHYMTKR